MRYNKIVEATFLNRPNRFVAECLIGDKIHKVHVKNTGRCKELLTKGAKVYLEDFRGNMGTRKMEFSLVTVIKSTDRGNVTVNMDSQAPNKVVKEALEDGTIKLKGMKDLSLIKGEKTFGNSRFDFYVEDIEGKSAYIEVKGVTLENQGLASFPDAPTERGSKHLKELIKVKEAGHLAFVIFVIQFEDVRSISPNDENDIEFGQALRLAKSKGVEILAYNSLVDFEGFIIKEPVKVLLD